MRLHLLRPAIITLLLVPAIIPTNRVCALPADPGSTNLNVNQFPTTLPQTWQPSKTEKIPVPSDEPLSHAEQELLRKANLKPVKRESRSFNPPNLEACIKNKLLRPFASRVLKEQVSDYKESIRGDYNNQPPSTFEGHCRLVWDGPEILSVILSSETYIGGAATSSTSVTALNLWKKSPARLAANKVFKPGVAKKLAVYAAAQVLHETNDDLLALKTFDSENDEFENFALSANGVEFLFAKSDFADDRMVTVPYANLLALLEPNFVKRSGLPFSGADLSEAEKNLERSLIISAIGTLSEIIASTPTNDAAYTMRASWYKKLGREETAKSDEQKARELKTGGVNIPGQ